MEDAAGPTKPRACPVVALLVLLEAPPPSPGTRNSSAHCLQRTRRPINAIVPSVTLPQPGHVTCKAFGSDAGCGLGAGGVGGRLAATFGSEAGRDFEARGADAGGWATGAAGTSSGARQLRQAKRRPPYLSLTLNVEPQAAHLTGIDIRLPRALKPDVD